MVAALCTLEMSHEDDIIDAIFKALILLADHIIFLILALSAMQ